MLKIVYRICCGMDVHKSFVVVCIASTDEQGVTSCKSKWFFTFAGNLRRCAAWLAENNCKDVCMESTGKYWIPVCNIPESTCGIVLAHPEYVKAIWGKKTDKRDAKWIADIFKHDLAAVGGEMCAEQAEKLRIICSHMNRLEVCKLNLESLILSSFYHKGFFARF